jgi:hypothetical protein
MTTSRFPLLALTGSVGAAFLAGLFAGQHQTRQPAPSRPDTTHVVQVEVGPSAAADGAQAGNPPRSRLGAYDGHGPVVVINTAPHSASCQIVIDGLTVSEDHEEGTQALCWWLPPPGWTTD